MNRFFHLTFAILLAAVAAVGCSGGGGNNTGTGGTGGADPSFMAMVPCSTEASYVTTGTTVAFGGTDPGQNYAPKCLKVSAGATVTFNGDFSMHPLVPSSLRGTTAGNPITATSTDLTKTFAFLDGGFYAYYCSFHGTDDTEFMNGVVWVK